VQQPFQVVFGRRVRQLRTQKNWSQEQMAERAGLVRETISNIERGQFGTHFEHVDTIVNAFDMTFSAFFSELDEES
jgi:transcriptional regulator with XRE-family HTH domain